MSAPSQGRILRADELVPTPWRNGLGVTREIALFPPGADTDDFLWRASVADVVGPAPFSRFPGVDRVIVLLEGAGFHMTLDDGRRHALTKAFAPFAFAGEAGVSVVLEGGGTRDFNLMLRRGQASGRIDVWQGPAQYACPADLALLYVARGTVDAPAGQLRAADTWLAGDAPSGAIRLSADAVALAVRVTVATG